MDLVDTPSNLAPTVHELTGTGLAPIDLELDEQDITPHQSPAAPGDCTDPNNYVAPDEANGFFCCTRISMGSAQGEARVSPENVHCRVNVHQDRAL